MHESLLWVLVLGASAALPAWCLRRKLAALARDPTPGFLRTCRAIGAFASVVCGGLSVVLIWAGATEPQVSPLYAVLGMIVLALNALLFIRPARRG